MVGAACARIDRQLRDGADGGQSLAAKAERGDIGKVAVWKFRCRVALDGKLKIGRVHAATVVDDADQAPAAVLQRDLDRRGAGVQSIFHEFLNGGGRPFDDLAGGDPVHSHAVEKAHAHRQTTRKALGTQRYGEIFASRSMIMVTTSGQQNQSAKSRNAPGDSSNLQQVC